MSEPNAREILLSLDDAWKDYVSALHDGEARQMVRAQERRREILAPFLPAPQETEGEQEDEDAHGYSRSDLLFGGNW